MRFLERNYRLFSFTVCISLLFTVSCDIYNSGSDKSTNFVFLYGSYTFNMNNKAHIISFNGPDYFLSQIENFPYFPDDAGIVEYGTADTDAGEERAPVSLVKKYSRNGNSEKDRSVLSDMYYYFDTGVISGVNVYGEKITATKSELANKNYTGDVSYSMTEYKDNSIVRNTSGTLRFTGSSGFSNLSHPDISGDYDRHSEETREVVRNFCSDSSNDNEIVAISVEYIFSSSDISWEVCDGKYANLYLGGVIHENSSTNIDVFLVGEDSANNTMAAIRIYK